MKYFSPIEQITGADILLFRKESGMTRKELASFLGVTAKAVEAWEYGKASPSGPVCRLMSLVSAIPPEDIRSAGHPLPFELLSPQEIHFLDGRTFVDPRYHIQVTWKDCGDLLYLDFNYLGTRYHVPARHRFRESQESAELLCHQGSELLHQFLLKKEWDAIHP